MGGVLHFFTNFVLCVVIIYVMDMYLAFVIYGFTSLAIVNLGPNKK